MAGLLATGAALLFAGSWAVGAHAGWLWRMPGAMVIAAGVAVCALGLMMAIYAVAGKARVRDVIIGSIAWRGDETVLDVGVGRGLLAIGAAKQLTGGHVVGIDVWAAKDLSGNGAEAARRNAETEGVADRVVIQDGDICRTDFPDATFDVALSLLCLHNIEDASERDRACAEIARILKPGGRVIVGDYVPTHRYACAFAAAGLLVERSEPRFGAALSLMWIVSATKPV